MFALMLQARPEFSWLSWGGDSTLRAGLLLILGLYLLGIGPIRERYRLGPPVSRPKAATFLAGVALLFLSLDGPLHELADYYLFSAHMLQHMLVTFAAPPLLLLGTPDWLLRPLIRPALVRRAAGLLTHPATAFLLFNGTLIGWHVPPLYEAAMRDHRIHIAQHLMLISTAVITWWPLLSPLPELPALSYPLRLLYVFFQTFPGFIIGSYITKSGDVLYPFYAEAPRVWPISPMDDQILGGLMMWVGGGVYLLFVFSALFFVWVYNEHVDDDAVDVPGPYPTPPGGAAVMSGTRPVVAVAPDKLRLN